MSSRCRMILSAVLCFGVACGAAHAEFLPGGKYYFGMLGGWTSLSSQQSKLFIPNSPAPISSVREHYDLGDWNFAEHLLAGIRAGYEWGPWRFEEEYSFRHAWMFRFAGAPAGHTGDTFKGSRDSHAFLTNLIYELPVSWPVRPHIGIGIGAVEVRDSVSVNQPLAVTPSFSFAPGEILRGNTWQPGIQGIAGIRYDITPTLALDIEYRYLKLPNFTLTNRATPGVNYRTGYDTHHSVLSLVMKFE